ncbi:MAG: hypothetical protein Q8N12_05190 [Thermodesulfovibrionales bacterium]|nr:hypothetical protein [Thermodesulfovibrionales bacterium]
MKIGRNMGVVPMVSFPMLLIRIVTFLSLLEILRLGLARAYSGQRVRYDMD